MEIEVFNPNKIIREKIISLLGDSEELEESMIKIYEYLELLRFSNYKKYKTIIGVMFSDFWVLGQGDLLSEEDSDYELYSNEMLEFTSVEDVIYYLDETPELLDEMIYKTIYFYDYSDEKKRRSLLRCSSDSRYIQNINPYHLFDKAEYCRKYDKDYLFYLYQKEIVVSKQLDRDIDTAKLFAKERIEIFLDEFRFCDRRNYQNLISELVKDFYILEKYKDFNNSCIENKKAIIRQIENIPVELLVDLVEDDLNFISSIVSSFVELNEKKEEEYDKIKTYIKKRTEDNKNVKQLLEL